MSHEILAPVFVLVALHLIVTFTMGAIRLTAIRKRRVDVRYFKHFEENYEVPAMVRQVSNNYRNLFEFPVAFYVLCLALAVTGLSDTWHLAMAWFFVGTRVIHSLVHITYNNVLHRFLVFVTGVITVAVMWVRFALDFFGG